MNRRKGIIQKNKIFIMILFFCFLFAMNYIFDLYIRPNNIDIVRNCSVAFGISLGIGIVWIKSDKNKN
ncbi:hypothetical protein [Anaerosacchariphilus polymeriproducens]|uniref:Uncharacterized protein n=1 Tax=Anaerosacchariphilus polymeriproducens TaxID=1812858 RepID=A0A371AY53_9FIRM|nr:hypothetical protein [Anaerosacchariphilus polymeriproducens]RDU24420.1 hypothetical protein DWV06_02780 [Anaerosacchariphilus polymeriproducens]